MWGTTEIVIKPGCSALLSWHQQYLFSFGTLLGNVQIVRYMVALSGLWGGYANPRILILNDNDNYE